MTMHLEHPSLSLSGKKKGKFKWASAEQKRQHEELNRSWTTLVETTKGKVLSNRPLTRPFPKLVS